MNGCLLGEYTNGVMYKRERVLLVVPEELLEQLACSGKGPSVGLRRGEELPVVEGVICVGRGDVVVTHECGERLLFGDIAANM